MNTEHWQPDCVLCAAVLNSFQLKPEDLRIYNCSVFSYRVINYLVPVGCTLLE
jgi:hypothetical protein